jgi:hypothetical protein
MKTTNYAGVGQHGPNSSGLSQNCDAQRIETTTSPLHFCMWIRLAENALTHVSTEPPRCSNRGGNKRYFTGLNQGGSAPPKHTSLNHSVDCPDDGLH